MHTHRVKYPRTLHLPWSPGATSDDKILNDTRAFEGREVIVTEKMDGENTTLYRDGMHARSLDSRHHPSRDWIKRLQGAMGWQIPEGWRVCGENLYAQHSIRYEQLRSYFYVFSVWDERRVCLSWDATCEWAELLGLEVVPVLYRGPWDEAAIEALGDTLDLTCQEGYVVRCADAFEASAFASSVAKWVRAHHVQTDTHWMHQAVVANGLASSDDSALR